MDTDTKHSDDCRAEFGERTAGCPRCDEVKAEAKPLQPMMFVMANEVQS